MLTANLLLFLLAKENMKNLSAVSESEEMEQADQSFSCEIDDQGTCCSMNKFYSVIFVIYKIPLLSNNVNDFIFLLY